MSSGQALLEVQQLGLRCRAPAGSQHLLHELDFELDRGQTLALVGESGSGKSLCARSLLRLLPEGFEIEAGSRVLLDGRDLLAMSEAELRGVRGRRIALAFQEPSSALHPMMRVGAQVEESLVLHRCGDRRSRRRRVVELLEQVGLAAPERRAREYPHQLSGGMRQRVMLAVALAAAPDVLIADEPTTALDKITQVQILALLRDLQQRTGVGILLISHDLAMVARIADRVMVLHEGRLVEQARTAELFENPRHPRSRALLDAHAALARRRVEPGARTAGVAEDPPLLQARDLVRVHVTDRDLLGRPCETARAVEQVDLELRPGERLGILGESGSGKSSLARMLCGLDPADGGLLRFEARDVQPRRRRSVAAMRRSVQMIFQDPDRALNPRLRIGEALDEVLGVHGRRGEDDVRSLLERVGLDPSIAPRWPHQLSAGQRQRVVLARALAVRPRVLIADEPVSSLDASVQAQILDLLDRLHAELHLSLVLVSHDIEVVERATDRVLVMLAGRVVEQIESARLRTHAAHPYTQALLAASPPPGSRRLPEPLAGEAPSPYAPRQGCAFAARCPQVADECRQRAPDLRERSPGHHLDCRLAAEGEAR